MTKPPVIGVAGWKNSGKTTLTVKLVEAFAARGLKVATIKHAHHSFQIDEGETDSARHRRAGASEVAIVSGGRWAIVHELRDEPEPSFSDMLDRLSPVDLVIAEGFKGEPISKVEVRRSESNSKEPLAASDPNIIAIATDHETDGGTLPVFALDDIDGIAKLIAQHLGLHLS